MEIKTMITAIISAVVALIIVVVVAIPIISNVTEDVNTVQYNDTPRFFAEDKVNEEIVYTIVDNQVMYNGIPLLGFTASDGLAPVAISDTFQLVYHMGSASTMELRAGDSLVGTMTSFTLMPDGTYTYINTNSTTGNGTYNKIINADPYGDFAAIETTASSVTVNMDTEETGYVFIRAYTATTSNVLYAASFNTTDGLTPMYIDKGNAETVTYAEPTVEANRLHNSITFVNKVTADDSQIGGKIIAIVPYEYHTITSSDDAIVSMINVVPLLMIVGIIVAVTAAFIRTR